MGAITWPHLGALVLAAGASRRMGSPKALLEVGGGTALALTLELARRAGCVELVVVLRAEQGTEEGVARTAGASVVANPHPERGMFSSVRLGLQAIPEVVDWTLLWPVDFALVAASTVERLVGAIEPGASGEADVIQPTHGGRGGHPILVSARAARLILAAADGSTLREILAPLRKARVEMEADPLVIQQANTPVEWERARALRDERERADSGPPPG